MSSGDSTPIRNLDTRFSTPDPTLDDHRRKRVRPGSRLSKSSQQMSPNISAKNNANVPQLELQQATPHASQTDNINLLKVDEALRHRIERNERNLIARDFEHRDFEHAIDDEDDDSSEGEEGQHRVVGGRRFSARRMSAYRDSRRSRRLINPGERSRDTSTTRSSSPANSVEAFAEPRRRQRANTASSHPSLVDFRQRGLSFAESGTRRPTLSNLAVPQAASVLRSSDRISINDVSVDGDDEHGKTYKIDFEELDEFVALCGKDGAPGDSSISQPHTLVPESHVFDDLRNDEKYDINNAALNPETFYETPTAPTDSCSTQVNSCDKDCPGQSACQEPCRDRFAFFSSEIQTQIYGSCLGDLIANGETFRDLFDMGPDGGVWWLDVQNPTKAELEVITKAFRIHRLTREDIETQEAREKVELFSSYYFVCFRTFNPDKGSSNFLDPVNVYIIVTADGVLSFTYAAHPHARNVRRRITNLGDFVSLGPDYICYAMIDDIVDSFAPIIHEAERISESIEDQVFVAREDDLILILRQIADCRKSVLNMMRLLGGKADVIKGFAKRCNDQYSIAPRGDIGLYLGDIQDHVVTMMSNLGHIEKMLSRCHTNYLAQLNVDHIMRGNSTNKALANITIVGTVIIPLNLVTGLFGMNVHIPGQDNPDDHFAWFFGIIGVLVCFVVCSLTVARRLNYISL